MRFAMPLFLRTFTGKPSAATMSAQPDYRHYTAEEYLALERKAEYKSEFFNGEIFMMAGASERHNVIATSLTILIGNHLWRKSCQPYGSDMRLHIPENSLYTYPDLTVVCGKAEFLENANPDTLLNPVLIVEVLSGSTEKYDRGGKFRLYRSIPSLRGYVMVASEYPFGVESYHKADGGVWQLTESQDVENGSVHLPSIGFDLPLREVYARVMNG